MVQGGRIEALNETRTAWILRASEYERQQCIAVGLR